MSDERSREPAPRRDPPAGLWPEMRRRLDAERTVRGRLRSLPTRTRVLLSAAVFALVAAVVVAVAPRPDTGGWSPVSFLGVALAPGAAGLLLLGTGLSPLQRRRRFPRIERALVVSAFLLPVVLGVLPPGHDAPGAWPESFADREAGLAGPALRCLLVGTALGLPLLLLVRFLDRRDGPPGLPGLAAVAAAGLLGVLALHLHCPLVSRSHRLAGHATVPFLLLVLLFAVAWCNRRRKPA